MTMKEEPNPAGRTDATPIDGDDPGVDIHPAPDPELLERIRESYNLPGDVPKGRIWEAIEGELAPVPSPWFRHASRIAAGIVLLAIGVGIGRVTAPERPVDVAAGGNGVERTFEETTMADDRFVFEERDDTEDLFQTFAHLREADLLLEILIEEGDDGPIREHAARWAESLLTETRLLRDMYGDGLLNERLTELAALLEEVETTLAQVARLEGLDDDEEGSGAVHRIARLVEAGSLRSKIRSLLPSATS